MTVTANQLISVAESQFGKRYVFGANPPTSDPSPRAFDCSGYTSWCCRRLGINLPAGSWIQKDWCATKPGGRLITVAEAMKTRGALLIRDGEGANGHVIFVRQPRALGGGGGFVSSAEAKGSRWGVGSWPIDSREFNVGALIPGINYNLTQPVPTAPTPFGGTDMFSPTDVVDVLERADGCWQLTADGGVMTVSGQFFGSYPALPPAQRQGIRFFTAITNRVDGRPDGYTLWANDRALYSFPV